MGAWRRAFCTRFHERRHGVIEKRNTPAVTVDFTRLLHLLGARVEVGGMAGHAGPPVGPASDVVLPLHSLKKRGATA